MPRSKVQYGQESWNVGNNWKVRVGELRRVGRKSAKANPLFKYVAEKLPWGALSCVSKYLKDHKVKRVGVYMAHDSFGVARYPAHNPVSVFDPLPLHMSKRSFPDIAAFELFVANNTSAAANDASSAIFFALIIIVWSRRVAVRSLGCSRRPFAFQPWLDLRSVRRDLFSPPVQGVSQQKIRSGPCTCNARR